MINILSRLKKFFSPAIILEVIFYLLSVGMAVYFEWSVSNLVFFLIFLRLVIHPVSSRFPAGAAIGFLILTAAFLVFKREELGRMAAIWASSSMILIVVMAFFEILEKPQDGIEQKA